MSTPDSQDVVYIDFVSSSGNETVRATLRRHLAPRTVSILKSHLEIEKELITRAVPQKGEVGFPLRLGRVGTEKGRKEVKKGEVGFWVSSKLLMVFLEDKETYSPVSILGSVEDISFFANLKRMATIRLRLVYVDFDGEEYIDVEG